jgi:hypothetical protein
LILTVREDGKKLPAYFIKHQRKRYQAKVNPLTGKKEQVVVDKGISGLNNELMDDWVTWFLDQPAVKEDDILCFDQHRSHINEAILARLRDSGIGVLPFPKGAAAHLSMLDNSLFKDYKQKFNKAWIKKGHKLEDKEEIIEQTWTEFPVNNIKGYWRKCGYLEKRRQQPNNSTLQRIPRVERTAANTRDIRDFLRPRGG